MFSSSLRVALLAALALSIGAFNASIAFGQDDDLEAADDDSSGDDDSLSSDASSDDVGSDGEPSATASDDESEPVAGWFRVDTDSLGTQFWFGATHKLGSLDIASDIYVVGTFAELDIGVALSFGDLALTPMVGIGFDFGTQEIASLIAPQLFTIYDKGPIYFESWIQFFINSPFLDDISDTLYTRNFALYKVTDSFHVGPQIELSIALNESADGADDSGLSSLPLGGRVNVGYGANNTLGIFVGYDVEAPDGSDGIAGRFTFLRTW